MDSDGQTLEFLLSPTRDAEAAKRFFGKALRLPAGCVPQGCPVKELATQLTLPTPRVITVEKNAVSPTSIAELKAAGVLPEAVELRPVKSLNNLIEQDHRFIKRLAQPGMGSFSFETAWRT